MNRFIFMAILVISVVMSASAQDIEVGGLKYKLLGNGKLEVVGGAASGNIVIPEKIEFRGRELTVTSVGENAFSGAKINSVKLPATIKTIEERAFINSTINSVNFPMGLYWIGKEAFENTQLDSIFFPKTLANHPHWRSTGIGEFSFRGCNKLRVVEFDTEGCAGGPENFFESSETNPIRVYAGAFDDCDNIEKIIYNGKPPIFDPYINDYKSRTFPKIVLEFATLYCPAWYIDKGKRFEGFAVVKPLPESVPIYDLNQRKKSMKEKVENQLTAAIKTGSVGYVDRNFICGIKPFFPAKGDPKIENIFSENGTTVIVINQKKNQSIHCKFNYFVEKVKVLSYDSSNFTEISAIYNDADNIAIFKCEVEYISEVFLGNSYGYSRYTKHATDYCLWYNGQVYRIDKKNYDFINNLFKDIENEQKEEEVRILSDAEKIKQDRHKNDNSSYLQRLNEDKEVTFNNIKKPEQFVDGFPTPEYTYTLLFDPNTRNHDNFFKSLQANGFKYVELLEYVNPNVGTISFMPGSGQDAVFITIHNKNLIEKIRKEFEAYFKQKSNCNVDTGFEDSKLTMTISYDY